MGNLEENVSDTTENENVDIRTTEENEENTTEDTGKQTKNDNSFTPEQQKKIDEIIKSRVASTKRAESKKYSKLLNSLKAGLGTDDLNEMTEKITEFYTNQGVDIPEITPKYNEEDEETLANADAQKIIDMGYEAMVSEADYLKNSDDKRDKKIYSKLENEINKRNQIKELEKIGVTEEEYQNKDFQDFVKKFNNSTSYTDIYDMYLKIKNKKPSPIGSMKSTAHTEEIKEYYSPDDVDKLTEEQLNNPKIWERVMESKKKWVNR